MPAFGLILALGVISVASVLIFSIWGLPVVAVAVLAAVVFLLVGRKGDSSIGTIERGRKVEPTGRPRKASGGAETANDRVGQP